MFRGLTLITITTTWCFTVSAETIKNCVHDWINGIEKCEIVDEMSGVEIWGNWTWEGVGSVQLEYQTGLACYDFVGYCYSYQFTLAFRQVGESSFGMPLKLTFHHADGMIWLPGAERGGLEIWLNKSALPLHDEIVDIQFDHSPIYWE